MARNLGIPVTDQDDFYFISYNSEDADRISLLVKRIYDADIPLWYDNGLDYGDKWEEEIGKRIAQSKAMIFFFTKGILEKEDPYVLKEFRMANRLDRKVFIILVDKIDKEMGIAHPDKATYLDDFERKHFPNDIDALIERLQKDSQIMSPNSTIHQEIKVDVTSEGSVIVDSDYLLNKCGIKAIDISKRHVELDFLTIDSKMFPDAIDVEGDASTWEDMISEAADCTANLIVNKRIVGYMDFIPVTPENYIALQTKPFTKDYVEYYDFGGRFDIFVSMFSIDPNNATPSNYLLFIKWMVERILKWKEQDIHIGKIEFSIYSKHQAQALEKLGFHLLLTNQLKGMLYEIKVEDLLDNPIIKTKFNDARLPIYQYQAYDQTNTDVVKQCLDIASSLSISRGGLIQYETAPQDSDIIIAATRNNIIAGYLCLKKYAIFNEGIYIEQIAIRKNEQRLGIGRKLISLAIKHAKENNIKEIYANVKKINVASLSLFKANGFVEFEMSKEQYNHIGIEDNDIDKNVALIYKNN